MITVSFPGRFSSLDRIRNFYTAAGRQAGLEGKAVDDVKWAVDEAASNIIQHAYGGENKGEIECSYSIDTDGLIVMIRDFGKPFNPKQVKNPDLKSDMCCRDEGGLGLHFMRSLMDSVEFTFNGHGGNLLTMIKRPHRINNQSVKGVLRMDNEQLWSYTDTWRSSHLIADQLLSLPEQDQQVAFVEGEA